MCIQFIMHKIILMDLLTMFIQYFYNLFILHLFLIYFLHLTIMIKVK